MNNRLIRKKPNRFLYGRNNYFDIGGTLPLKDAKDAVDYYVYHVSDPDVFNNDLLKWVDCKKELLMILFRSSHKGTILGNGFISTIIIYCILSEQIAFSIKKQRFHSNETSIS